jgi:TonB family protein
MGSTSIRREWEGLVVDGTFALLEWLGGNEERGVFLTVRHGTQRAAIKLIAASGAAANEYLAQWTAARSLSHPSLTPMLETGRSTIAGTEMVYVVTELAQGSLSKTIQEHAVRAEEAKEFFDPVLDALLYLHGKGFIHGHVKPSNILVVNGQVKLSGDDFFVTNGTAKSAWEPSAYDAPEVASGMLTEVVDSWSVGMTLVEAMTQRLPVSGTSGEPVVPKSLPEPFDDVVRECFRLEPEQRATIGRIRGRLYRDEPAEAEEEGAAAEEERAPIATEPVVKGEERAPIAAEPVVKKQEQTPIATEPIREPEPEEAEPVLMFRTGIEDAYLGKKPKWPIAIGVAVLLAVAAVLMVRGDNYKRFLPLITRIERAVSPAGTEGQSPTAPPSNAAAPGNVAPQSAPPQVAAHDEAQDTPAAGQGETQPQSAAPATGGDTNAPATGDGGTPSGASERDSPEETQTGPADGRDETKPESPTSRVSHEVNAGGEVASRVLPSVSKYAISSMQRPVEVVVRVSVNRSGNVSSAEYVSPGPGNYFAKVSQQAAKSWRFKPPIQGGEPAQSVWMLQFYFSRTEIKASAVEMGR